MSLQVRCSLCKQELQVPGALLFSPPDSDNMCRKDHYCNSCYGRISYVLFEMSTGAQIHFVTTMNHQREERSHWSSRYGVPLGGKDE